MMAFSLDYYGVNDCAELQIDNDTLSSTLYFHDATSAYQMNDVISLTTTPTAFN